MIAVVNNVVAGAVVSIVVQWLAPGVLHAVAIASGIAFALMLTFGFLHYQRWRYALFDTATKSHLS